MMIMKNQKRQQMNKLLIVGAGGLGRMTINH